MKLNLHPAVKLSLLVGSVYLILDGLLHLLNIRLTDARAVWPPSAMEYGRLISQIYASFVILVGLIGIELHRNPEKYRRLVLLSGAWAFLHGAYLVGMAIARNYAQIFSDAPSLSVWLPYYDSFISLEGLLMILYGVIVFRWSQIRSSYGER